jgi:hypothetical protein
MRIAEYCVSMPSICIISFVGEAAPLDRVASRALAISVIPPNCGYRPLNGQYRLVEDVSARDSLGDGSDVATVYLDSAQHTT